MGRRPDRNQKFLKQQLDRELRPSVLRLARVRPIRAPLSEPLTVARRLGERSTYGDLSISTIAASLLWNQSPSVGARIALHWRRRLRRPFLFGGSMEYATPPSPRLSRAGKQVQPASRSTPRSADTPTLRTLERRIGELENLTTSQSRELQIQFERIAQLQAECDILRIRFIKP